MKPELRRVIAFAAACFVKKEAFRTIYDINANSHSFMNVTLSGDQINIYDFATGSFIAGDAKRLYHYGSSCFINLNIDGSNFNGYVFGENTHFTGNLNGTTCQVYDYSNATFSFYMLG